MTTPPAPPVRPPSRSLVRRLGSRLATLGSLVAHFARGGRWFLLPLLLVILLAGLLLVLTGGLSYVAPFIYSIF